VLQFEIDGIHCSRCERDVGVWILARLGSTKHGFTIGEGSHYDLNEVRQPKYIFCVVLENGDFVTLTDFNQWSSIQVIITAGGDCIFKLVLVAYPQQFVVEFLVGVKDMKYALLEITRNQVVFQSIFQHLEL